MADVMIHHVLNVVARVERHGRVELPMDEVRWRRRGRCWTVVLPLNVRVDLNLLLIRRGVRFRLADHRISPRRLRRLGFLHGLVARHRHGSIAVVVVVVVRATWVHVAHGSIWISHQRIVSFSVKRRGLHVAACFRRNTWNGTGHDWTTRLADNEREREDGRRTDKHTRVFTLALALARVFFPKVDYESMTKEQRGISIGRHPADTGRTIGLREWADADHGGLACP